MLTIVICERPSRRGWLILLEGLHPCEVLILLERIVIIAIQCIGLQSSRVRLLMVRNHPGVSPHI